MVVPPPPPARPVRESFLLDDGEEAGEPAGVDWLMIGLFIVAFVAVLGLIPLWRTVYRRYTAPPPPSDGARYFQPARSEGVPELDEMTVVWYNVTTGGHVYLEHNPNKLGIPESRTYWGFSPGVAPQTGGLFPGVVSFGVWESRLRV